MELEKFDLEKAKAGRKVIEKREPNFPVIKWDTFGKSIAWIIGEDERIRACDSSEATDFLALAPEERYVILFEDLQYGGTVVSGSFWVNEKDAINYGESITDKDLLKYLGTYKLVKV